MWQESIEAFGSHQVSFSWVARNETVNALFHLFGEMVVSCLILQSEEGSCGRIAKSIDMSIDCSLPYILTVLELVCWEPYEIL